jgi:hypothetical protein
LATGKPVRIALRRAREGVVTVNAAAPDTDELRQLDADTRRAWRAYSARLRELTGEEYERAERQSWVELQTELRRLARRRESVASHSATPR